MLLTRNANSNHTESSPRVERLAVLTKRWSQPRIRGTGSRGRSSRRLGDDRKRPADRAKGESCGGGTLSPGSATAGGARTPRPTGRGTSTSGSGSTEELDLPCLEVV